MKTFFICLLFISLSTFSKGQILHFKTGKTLSAFHYKDSKENYLDNLNGSNQNYLAMGIRKFIAQSKFMVTLEMAYNRYGASGSNPIYGNYYEWDVNYIGLNAGFGYEFFKPSINYNEQRGFSFYPQFNIASEFLLQGSQNLNNQVYDLKGAEEFDLPLYFARGGLGVNYYISKQYILFAEYIGGTSILIGDYKGREQLRIITHTVCVGFSINLFYMIE
jgi:hypothetical protein